MKEDRSMDKININLNPQKKSTPSAVMQNLVSYTPLVGLCTVLGLILILFLQIFVVRRIYVNRRYSVEWAGWTEKSILLSKIKQNIANLEQEKERLQELNIPRYEIYRVFGDIFSSLPKNIWFEKLTFSNGFLNLEGNIVRWQEDYLVSLDRFIDSLQESEYFSSKFEKVNIKESRKVKFNGIEVLNFIIECKS